MARNADAEPAGAGAPNPGWYVKAGLGMADTLRLTQQCPTGGCYTITDRGTLQQLIANGALTTLTIAMDAQAGTARGGATLIEVNQYRGYALAPAKVPAARTEGALAFLDFLTAAGFQRRLRGFPTAREPGFFPAALPDVELERGLPRRSSARRALLLRGTIAPAVPGTPALDGAQMSLTRFSSPLTATTLATATTRAGGGFRLRWRPDRSGRVFLDRAALPRPLAAAALARTRPGAGGGHPRQATRAVRAHGRLRSRVAGHGSKARANRGAGKARVAAAESSAACGSASGRKRFELGVALAPGRWQLRVLYVDDGIVGAGRSARRSVVVG